MNEKKKLVERNRNVLGRKKNIENNSVNDYKN